VSSYEEHFAPPPRGSASRHEAHQLLVVAVRAAVTRELHTQRICDTCALRALDFVEIATLVDLVHMLHAHGGMASAADLEAG
jgi:hypothetical protein